MVRLNLPKRETLVKWQHKTLYICTFMCYNILILIAEKYNGTI